MNEPISKKTFDGKEFSINAKTEALIAAYANSIVKHETINTFGASVLKLRCIANLKKLNPSSDASDLNALQIQMTFEKLPEDIWNKVSEAFACPRKIDKKKNNDKGRG